MTPSPPCIERKAACENESALNETCRTRLRLHLLNDVLGIAGLLLNSATARRGEKNGRENLYSF